MANYLELSYPNFVLGQIIDPEEANQNNRDITNKINEFVTEVNDANTTSASAESKADSAVTTAASAETKADSAVTTANSANTTAGNAVTTANGAVTIANNAKATAEGVQTDYNTIKPTIEQAINDANAAVDLVEETIVGTIFDQVGAVTEEGKFTATVDGDNDFEIPLAIYSQTYDYLEVIYKGIVLTKDVHYTITNRVIHLLFDLVIGEEIYYRISKNRMMPENFADGAWLYDKTVTKAKLEQSVQDTLNNVPVLEAQINSLDAEVDTHKTEVISNVLVISRDISIAGVQAVSVPFLAKTIQCKAFISSLKTSSDGFFGENGTQRAISIRASDGVYSGQTSAIYIALDAFNVAVGTIQNVTATGFEINWTKTGSPTGTATIYILATTHGGIQI